MGLSFLPECVTSTTYLGGNLGMTGVLNTHTRRLDYHPHCLSWCLAALWIASGGSGGRQGDRTCSMVAPSPGPSGRGFWRPCGRAGLRSRLHPPSGWSSARVLAGASPLWNTFPGIFTAASSARSRFSVNAMGEFTFRYIESKSDKPKTRTVPGTDFLWLVLQHVLPKGFRRVRDYDFFRVRSRLRGIYSCSSCCP